MAIFSDLPFELREQIIVYALQIYLVEEFKASLREWRPSEKTQVMASFQPGQRTLNALKLTSKHTYADTFIASQKWLDYETIDLFERVEAINTKLRACDEGRAHRVYRCSMEVAEDYRRSDWIAKNGFSRIDKYRRKLHQLDTGKGPTKRPEGSVSIDSSSCSVDVAQGSNGSEQALSASDAPPRRLSRREEEMTVFFSSYTQDRKRTGEAERLVVEAAAKWKKERILPSPKVWKKIDPTDVYWWRPYKKERRS